MAEEIRRSGRANKGHHTKNQNALDEPTPAAPQHSKAQSKAAKRGRGSAKDQTARAHSPDHEEEEEDAIIRCVCGDQRDIRGRQMICCDMCLAWQHNKCLSLPEGDYWEGKDYYCEQCKPADHQELLAAMARGEKPWARKKGSKPRLRPSDVKPEASHEKSATPPAISAVPQIPVGEQTPSLVVAQEETNGRDQPKDSKTPPQSPVGEKRRHESTEEKANVSKRRRKSSQHENKVAPKTGPIVDIDSLPQLQKLLAESLRDTLVPLITLASDTRGYRIPDGETAKSLASRFALQISLTAHHHCGEPTGRESPYSSKLRAIIFNVKKNTVLVDQLLSGSLNTRDFVAMEPEEMASEDKQREYAAMREAAEKQMILTEEAGPRMRKTHKGEEIVGEDNYDAQEFKQPNLRERDDEDDAAMSAPTPSHPPESPADVSRPPVAVEASMTPTDQTRRPPTAFDINVVFDKVRSPQKDQQIFLPRRQSSMTGPEKAAAPVDDADVDRLLKDEDNDVEMSGYSSDPSVCWRGSISMQSSAPFDAVARFVAGGDFGQVLSWNKLLSSALSVQGRIESSKGDDYIRGIGHTESHDVAILALSPVTNEGRVVMDHLYSYFHSRGRWGVVPVDGFGNGVMRDLYVIPIEAGGSNLPPFIDMLEYCTIETPRKEHMILLALIAKLPEVKSQVAPTQHTEQHTAQESTIGRAPPSLPPTNGTIDRPSHSPAVHPPGPQFPPVAAMLPPGQYGNLYAQTSTNNSRQPIHPLPNAPPHHHIPKALEILGPLIDAPVIVDILGSNLSRNHVVSELILRNLRHIVETVPEARSNLAVLTDHMRQKSEASRQQQLQQSGTV